MASSQQKQAASTVTDVCNAESEAGSVSRSSVLEILARQRSAFEFLNVAGGLSPDSPCKFTRERFEIVRGKLMALDSVAGLVRLLPNVAPQEPHGGKTHSFSSWLDSLRESISLARAHVLGIDGFPARRAEEFLDESLAMVEKFPSSAGGQLGPREESRPPIGETPCDGGRGESPALFGEAAAFDSFDVWLEDHTSKELAGFCERILAELETRGSASRWLAVS